jgi:Ser/Thr protein kinase RdoA (MazF antagonist)
MQEHEGDSRMLSLAAYDLKPPVQIFALPFQGVNNTSAGVRTGGGDFIWKMHTSYDDLAAIQCEQHLLQWLAGAGLSFAVPVPIATRDGDLLYAGTEGWVSLTPWLPGKRLEHSRLDQVQAFGAAVGELLTALQRYSPPHRSGRSLFGSLFDFPQASLDPFTLTPERLGLPDVAPYGETLAWWRAEAAQLRTFVDGRYRRLPWQMCHNDVAPANILVDIDRVTAILDFEFAAPAARALDVAMGLRMTMRVWEHPEPWAVVRHFCRGYTRWLSLSEAEIQALPWLIRLRGAITVLWWLGRRDVQCDPSIILERIGYARNFAKWLEQHEWAFLGVLEGAARGSR